MIDFLFVKMFPLTKYIGTIMLPAYAKGVAVVIYLGYILIDQIRKWIYSGAQFCYCLIKNDFFEK